MSKATEEFYELAKGQGEIIGEIRGRTEGKMEGKTESLILMMKNLNCSLEEAFKTLEITDEEEQAKFRKLITT